LVVGRTKFSFRPHKLSDTSDFVLAKSETSNSVEKTYIPFIDFNVDSMFNQSNVKLSKVVLYKVSEKDREDQLVLSICALSKTQDLVLNRAPFKEKLFNT
jgi:hypothetical protein